MTPKFAQAVDPIFLHVLNLLDRTGRGENPSPLDERLSIRGWFDQAEAILGQSPEWELAKYALVAWIDEVLIESTWEGASWWNENALEVDFFNTRLANEQFYTKAKEASVLPRKDALEVFYVCAVLGFRGLYRDPMAAAILAEPRDLPPDLNTWAKQTAMGIRLAANRPPITEASIPGDGAPPLESQALMMASLVMGVVLAAISAVFGVLLFTTSS